MSTNIISAMQLTFNPPREGPPPPSCTYCQEPAVKPYTNPPLCNLHLDWVVLINFMQKREEEITPATIKARLGQALLNGGDWTLTEAHVDGLFNQFFPSALETLAADLQAAKNGHTGPHADPPGDFAVYLELANYLGQLLDSGYHLRTTDGTAVIHLDQAVQALVNGRLDLDKLPPLPRETTGEVPA